MTCTENTTPRFGMLILCPRPFHPICPAPVSLSNHSTANPRSSFCFPAAFASLPSAPHLLKRNFRADFLSETTPYLLDPAIGILQTPQYFRYRKEQTWVEQGAGSCQEFFYRMVQVCWCARNGYWLRPTMLWPIWRHVVPFYNEFHMCWLFVV